MSEELKPCPFCGSEILELDRNLSNINDFGWYWFVSCYDCPCRGMSNCKTTLEPICEV